MTRFNKLFSSLIVLFVLSVSGFAFGDNPPDWLRRAAASTVPNYDKEVPAVVLHNQEIVTLESNGKLVTTERFAVKVLTRDGRGYALARALYLVSSGKIKDIDAWLLPARGSSKSYGKKETLDIISDPDDVYDEYRMKIIDASNDADVGSVFGYEVVSEDVPLYYQTKWFPQSGLPSLNSSYTLNLPSGWEASSITFNSKSVSPLVNGTSYTWQMQNLPFIKREPMSPSVYNLVPWLAISYTPKDASQASNKKVFNNWTEISNWTTAMYDPQVIINDEVAAKAKELTANAKTELQKIQAIGTYVQNLQYISIDIGVGHGNGFRPRPSSLVLSRGYGDCKDKATLMRAMLKVLKIEAYPVIIYSGDPTFVRKEWASPGQFNHCIIAVKVSDETESPTIINDENLGRLLIFDATDDLTPVGDLPSYLQGSLALIAAGADGKLTEMPVTPPESNALERNVEVTLSENGSVTGKINELTKGQSSRLERTLFRKLSKGDYKKALEGWLTSGATAAKLINFTPKDNHAEASFNLEVEFSAPSYGQLMQNRLLIFKPAVVSRLRAVALTDKDRTYPVRLQSNSFTETAVFVLPKGFKVDEVPDELNLETSFGNYKTSYEVLDGKLTYKRTLIMNRTTVPTEKYDVVKDFFSQILNSEQSPVVLIRN